jgi:hypothetical protein
VSGRVEAPFTVVQVELRSPWGEAPDLRVKGWMKSINDFLWNDVFYNGDLRALLNSEKLFPPRRKGRESERPSWGRRCSARLQGTIALGPERGPVRSAKVDLEWSGGRLAVEELFLEGESFRALGNAYRDSAGGQGAWRWMGVPCRAFEGMLAPPGWFRGETPLDGDLSFRFGADAVSVTADGVVRARRVPVREMEWLGGLSTAMSNGYREHRGVHVSRSRVDGARMESCRLVLREWTREGCVVEDAYMDFGLFELRGNGRAEKGRMNGTMSAELKDDRVLDRHSRGRIGGVGSLGLRLAAEAVEPAGGAVPPAREEEKSAQPAGEEVDNQGRERSE